VGELDSRGHTHLLENVGAMELDRSRSDSEVLGNDLVVMAEKQFLATC
jgi:hypothetical protein